MGFFKKLKDAFLKLFRSSEEFIPTQEDLKAKTIDDIVRPEKAATREEVKSEVIQEENDSCEEPQAELQEENNEVNNIIQQVISEEEIDISTPSYLPFTDEDKNSIVNILRPVIKDLNLDDLYINICSLISESKVLKTYAKLSEDKMILTINLTQSNLFNNKIGEYIADHVEGIFQSNIDSNNIGKFKVTADSDRGCIEIKKIG